jgi:hypothetical protein
VLLGAGFDTFATANHMGNELRILRGGSSGVAGFKKRRLAGMGDRAARKRDVLPGRFREKWHWRRASGRMFDEGGAGFILVALG